MECCSANPGICTYYSGPLPTELSLVSLFICFYFDIGSHPVAQAGFEQEHPGLVPRILDLYAQAWPFTPSSFLSL